MVVAVQPNRDVKRKPFAYAPVSIFEGEQRSGKTESALTRPIDATFANLTAVKLPDGTMVKAQPLLNSAGYPLIGYGQLLINNGQYKKMKLPPHSCAIADSIRVIYNGHLHGIRYAHMELDEIIEHLNDGVIEDCYLVVDEAYIGADRREGLNPLAKVISKLGWQIGKRHIFFEMCLPDSSVLDLRLQKIETEHVVCSYNEVTRRITMFIRNYKKYKRTREVSYFAPLYWPYFDTDEKFKITEVQMARAIAMAGSGEDDD